MFVRILASMAVTFLTLSAAHAESDGSLVSAVLACSAQRDESAQLACYNRIAAQLRADTIPAPEPSSAVAPASLPQTAIQVRPALPPRPDAGAAMDFGKEDLPLEANAPAQNDHITAGVASVTYNYFHIFTITLDNGQVWRQLEGDTRVARFKNDKTETVMISRGFLDSFHLVIQGVWGDYAVKRIK